MIFMFLPNFEAISYVASVLGPKSLAQKAVLFRNDSSTGKNVLHDYMS